MLELARCYCRPRRAVWIVRHALVIEYPVLILFLRFLRSCISEVHSIIKTGFQKSTAFHLLAATGFSLLGSLLLAADESTLNVDAEPHRSSKCPPAGTQHHPRPRRPRPTAGLRRSATPVAAHLPLRHPPLPRQHGPCSIPQHRFPPPPRPPRPGPRARTLHRPLVRLPPPLSSPPPGPPAPDTLDSSFRSGYCFARAGRWRGCAGGVGLS